MEMIIVTSLDAMATVDVAGTEHMITGHRTKGVSVGAAGKVSPNWSQETITFHSFNCFSIV